MKIFLEEGRVWIRIKSNGNRFLGGKNVSGVNVRVFLRNWE